MAKSTNSERTEPGGSSSSELADLIYCCNQKPVSQIDHLLQIWATTLSETESLPYADHNDLHTTIDATTFRAVLWECFSVSYNGDPGTDKPAPWMTTLTMQYDLGNPDFAQEMDFAPKHDFMSGNWAWQQADLITKDPIMHDSTFRPAILGSNKTTVSVATGQNEYYPLYVFLSIPKNSPKFCHFCQQLFHSSLNCILQLLYGDGHYRRTIFGLSPYISDYPEQFSLCLLLYAISMLCRCTGHQNNLDREAAHHSHPFTHGFPCTDIHKLLSPDLLHQVIKGTFKDHLVTWIEEITAVLPFPGLCQFPEGCEFEQWMGDNSKALMNMYLPATSGHVLSQMVCAIAAFMEFCQGIPYLIRRSVLDEDDLVVLDNTIVHYHTEQEIFHAQHSIVHYRRLIQDFGAPNGLCSSIMESKHIKAILLINEHLDKLHATCMNFQVCRMLNGSMFNTVDLEISTLPEEDDDGRDVDTFHGNILGEVKLVFHKHLHNLGLLAQHLQLPELLNLVCHFLFEQITSRQDLNLDTDVSIDDCPKYHGKVYTYTSAITTYYAPSNLPGIGRMHYRDLSTFQGLHIACVLLFFSIWHEDILYPCMLVTWFSETDDQPCEEMCMWVVKPDLDYQDSILHEAHLIGVSGTTSLPVELKHSDSLDAFQCFYVNKYADHHSYEIAS
ncbi:hypothetical protein ARMGADRAFT_1048374 [Armillaria gallica]|uniref:Uncharacterized protein n=1 Tax=Armillaria gallica TaxID=47427 RepID=A0A2H3CWU5_ARMGA|nr:hypothetical protein ARMGADRAFT_1048374 [Armillaria gallica]